MIQDKYEVWSYDIVARPKMKFEGSAVSLSLLTKYLTKVNIYIREHKPEEGTFKVYNPKDVVVPYPHHVWKGERYEIWTRKLDLSSNIWTFEGFSKDLTLLEPYPPNLLAIDLRQQRSEHEIAFLEFELKTTSQDYDTP